MRQVGPVAWPAEARGAIYVQSIMVRALQNRLRISEFAATNSRREQGVSKMRVIRVSLRHLSLATRALFGVLGPPAAVEAHLERIGIHTT